MDPALQSNERRRFLGGLVAGAAFVSSPKTAPADDAIVLRAAPGRIRLLEDENLLTSVWGFNGQVPGPVLRARQGEPFRVRLANGLDQPLAIHWHGIRLDNSMDGTSLTQAPVAPGGMFDYAFSPPDAGTYWYHPLLNASGLRERGLSGLLLVEEKNPDRDRADVPLVIDDWLLDRQGQLDDASFGEPSHAAGEGRLGNRFTVNGMARPTLEAPADRELRLRVLNCANARTIEVLLKGAEGWVMARDGQPIAPLRIDDNAVPLAPGQRADLVLSSGTRKALMAVWTDAGVTEIATITRVGSAAPGNHAVSPLPANPLPDYFNYSATESPTLTIESGKGAGAARGNVWSYGGQAGLGEEPLFRVSRGVTVILTVDNISRHTHVIHIHGHVARVVARSGRPAIDASWGDTFVCPPIEPVKIIFIADNPGRWLISSTIAEHFDAGAQTWFEVTV